MQVWDRCRLLEDHDLGRVPRTSKIRLWRTWLKSDRQTKRRMITYQCQVCGEDTSTYPATFRDDGMCAPCRQASTSAARSAAYRARRKREKDSNPSKEREAIECHQNVWHSTKARHGRLESTRMCRSSTSLKEKEVKPGKYVISIGNPGFRYLEVTENGKMWITDHVAKVPLVIRSSK